MTTSYDPGPKQSGEFRITHLSDPHIGTAQSAFRQRLRSLIGKSHSRNLSNFQAVLRDMANMEIDHVVITGDLTNAAKPEEFKTVKAILADFVQPDRLTVVPGNHDISYRRVKRAYRTKGCPRKLWQFVHHFWEVFPSRYPPEFGLAAKEQFPFVKVLAGGEVVLIGLDTTGNLPTKIGLLNSFGWVGRAQMNELRALLKSPRMRDKIKIVAMHHHPMIVPVATMFDSFKYMFQSKELLDLLYESGVDLILHGHKHHPFCWQSRTFRDHDLTVICAGPPNAYDSAKSALLVYNIYSIEDRRITVHYRSFSPPLRPRTEFARK
ncbi:metallophosphoesterase [Candidatus Sumerlaeota bacterium]|nr:metallophosphoesterase [Candidatus Sumerlaeota bacterium]